MGVIRNLRSQANTLVLGEYLATPYAPTLHSTLYNLHPTLNALHPTPYTLHPTPYTLNPALYSPSHCCRSYATHVMLTGLESGPDFQVKALKTLSVVSSLLGSGSIDYIHHHALAHLYQYNDRRKTG